jgi:dipeptidase E
MHLYLSSYRLGDQPERLLSVLGENRTVAIIANARDQLSGEERQQKVEQEHQDLQSLGLTTEEIDLREYFPRPQDLPAVLDRFGMVWVRGGNTFLLRRAFAQSGADTYFRSKLNDPTFVYGGYSAGACVLCPTLHGIDLADEPDFSLPPYQPEIIWDGLDFVPYYIVPHYQSDHFESEMMENVVSYYRDRGLPFKTLRDGEVLVERTHE